MARIRTIKPEFPQSESMGNVSRDARLLFVLTWTIADDSGRLRGNSRMLASLLFPYDDDAPKLIDGWIDELVSNSCLIRYEVDGSTYIQICNWLSHQKIDKPSPSKIPEYDERSRTFSKPRERSSEDQGPRTKDQGVDQGPRKGPGEGEDTRADARRAHRLPPDFALPAEWIDDARQIKPDWPASKPAEVFEAFRDYWSSKSGKDATKTDWRATWRNWCRRERGFTRTGAGPPKLFEQQRREAMDAAFAEFVGESEAIEGEVQHG